MNDCDSEYKIISKDVQYDNGYKMHIEGSCDEYGMSINTVITTFNEHGDIVFGPVELLGF